MQITFHDVTLTFETDATVFSPHGLDRGTAAMLDVARLPTAGNFLDLGCGFGFVATFLAKTHPAAQVTAVDVDPDAVRLTQANAAANGTTIRALVSDGWGQLNGQRFDAVLSNPPYHTDFKVAKGFIEGAHRQLNDGGKLYMVTKRRTWYENKIRSVFGFVQVTAQDGYFVFYAEKRPHRPVVKPNQHGLSKKLARKEAKRHQHANRH